MGSRSAAHRRVDRRWGVAARVRAAFRSRPASTRSAVVSRAGADRCIKRQIDAALRVLQRSAAMLAIDTNIVVRYVTGDGGDEFARAVHIIENNPVLLSLTVVLETEWLLRDAYEFPRDDILSAFESLFGLPNVAVVEPLVLRRTITLAQSGLDFADALHVAQLSAEDKSLSPSTRRSQNERPVARFGTFGPRSAAASNTMRAKTMTYDLTVIGSGPGGYVCAIRAAQLGMKVAVVEKMKTLGGTCLNIGCIPSKALLYASEMFDEAGHGLGPLGVAVSPLKLDLPAMMKHKDATVAANVNGVAYLFKEQDRLGERRVAHCRSWAHGRQGADGKDASLETKASSSRPVRMSLDCRACRSTRRRLSPPLARSACSAPPKKLIVVGAGVIGLELGSVCRRVGSEVVVVEFLDHVLTGMDGEVSKFMQRTLEKQGFAFHLGHKLAKVEPTGAGVKATIEPAAGGEAKMLDADVVLVSVGRRPFTEGLGLEAARRQDGARPGRRRRSHSQPTFGNLRHRRMRSAGRCSPTRLRRRLWRSPNCWRGRRAT